MQSGTRGAMSSDTEEHGRRRHGRGGLQILTLKMEPPSSGDRAYLDGGPVCTFRSSLLSQGREDGEVFGAFG